ncbi:MAG: hypothetical protein JOZ92_04675 [Candidatus Dormibacteraeota bacterium]|nr:hypothetical protein [Candidatus Dormibacteraeota bacterium]
MFHHYFVEQQMALREEELRMRANRPHMQPSRRSARHDVARVLRTVADRLDSR